MSLRNLLSLCGLLVCMVASSQIVTTSPAIVQTDSKNIVITYHADEGNRGLAGLTASSKVYAHTGVITNESDGPGDWKYAPTWLDNSAKYEMKYAGADTWTLTIPSISTYYGTKAGESVEKLMFVFRDATGSREGKTALGGDIAVDVYPAGFQVVLNSSSPSNVVTDNSELTFTVCATQSSDIKLYLEGQASSPIAQASSVTTLTGKRSFASVGSYTLVAEATPVGGGETKKTTYTVVRIGQSVAQNYPGGTPKMGPVDNGDGSVTFCIAAPRKESMMLVSSANGYKVTAESQMKYQDYEGNRYFWTTVSGIKSGEDFIYYYLADGTTAVGDPYARLVLDPWSDKYIAEGVFTDMPQYPVGSVIEGLPLAVYNKARDTYNWQVKNFTGVDKSRLIIYELLIRDFTGTEGEANGEGTVQGVIDRLDYLQGLGVNAIELLPIMEFNGNNSWGYNTNFYFAPDKAYGAPNDYRRLVDECHSRGIAVILDIVFNQSDGLHPWYQLYPIAENPFYNAQAPHAYSVLNDWKQENPLVEQQWADALKYWLTEYNVDGFRFDLVKGLGDSDSYKATYNATTNAWTGVADGNTDAYNQSRINRMKRLHAVIKSVKPEAYFINEDLAGPEEENAMALDGQMNWSNINSASCTFAQGTASALNLFYAPDNGPRYWGSTVSYAESHDEERVAYAAANSSTASVKNSQELQMRRLGSLAAAMLLTPGAHMIWQFEEMGADQTTKNESGNDTSPKRVVWSYLDNEYRAGLKDTYAKIAAIRNANPDLYADSVATVDNLNNTSVASLKVTNGDKELVLVIYPRYLNMTSQCAVPMSFDASQYDLLAYSAGIDAPVLNAGKVGLKGGCFALYGTKNLVSAIGDIIADKDSIRVYADSTGSIVIEGDYDSAAAFDLQGRRVAMHNLPAGVYVVRVDSRSYKLLVK